jgi:hypothetical protein
VIEVVAGSLLTLHLSDVVLSATQRGLPIGPFLRAMSCLKFLVLGRIR